MSHMGTPTTARPLSIFQTTAKPLSIRRVQGQPARRDSGGYTHSPTYYFTNVLCYLAPQHGGNRSRHTSSTDRLLSRSVIGGTFGPQFSLMQEPTHIQRSNPMCNLNNRTPRRVFWGTWGFYPRVCTTTTPRRGLFGESGVRSRTQPKGKKGSPGRGPKQRLAGRGSFARTALYHSHPLHLCIRSTFSHPYVHTTSCVPHIWFRRA